MRHLPNLICLLRIALIWPVTGALQAGHYATALALFLAAAVSDGLDGYLAKRFGWTSALGKFLDPLADKLIVLSALVMLLRLDRVPVWVVCVILLRELLISGVRTLAADEGLVIAASQGGKWKTSLQLCGIICLMVHYHFVIDWLFAAPVTDFHAVGLVLLYVSLVPSVLSAADYVRTYYTLEGASRSQG